MGMMCYLSGINSGLMPSIHVIGSKVMLLYTDWANMLIRLTYSIKFLFYYIMYYLLFDLFVRKIYTFMQKFQFFILRVLNFIVTAIIYIH